MKIKLRFFFKTHFLHGGKFVTLDSFSALSIKASDYFLLLLPTTPPFNFRSRGEKLFINPMQYLYIVPIVHYLTSYILGVKKQYRGLETIP
jgi:hypothetical protein